MKKIISKDNLQIKKIKKLGQKKFRKEYLSFVVENFVIIRDAFLSGIEMESLFVTEEFFKDNKFKELISKIPGNKIFLIDAKINKYVSCLDTPSGLFAEYKIKENNFNDKQPILYLNGVNDPGNLGTILRTSLAFGFENIICDEKCADIYNQKTISAAKDSIFKLNIKKDKDFSLLKENQEKLPIYIAESSSGEDISGFIFPEKYFLVFGSESHGIDKEIINISNTTLNIVISKNIESLNVSCAVAIILYEINKKHSA